MVQTPSDMGSDAGIASGSGRCADATIVADPPLCKCQSADAVPPSELCEITAVPHPDAEGEREEPSIEEYMAALLQRTRQFSTSPRGETPAAARPAVKCASRTVTPASASPASPPSAVTGAAAPSVPECRDAFSELRELANISTRSSFNAHRVQVLVREMRGTRTVTCVAMVVSLTLLSLSSSVASSTYITAVAAVITACAYGMKYLKLGRELAWLYAESGRYMCSDG